MKPWTSFLLAGAAVCLLAMPAAAADKKIVKVRIVANGEAGGYEAYRAMDGDPKTMWHTPFGNYYDSRHPHELTIDLGSSFAIGGLAYLPREGGGNGTIKNYEILISQDGKNFGTPILKGAFAKPADWNELKFPSLVKTRFVKVRALSEVGNRPWASIAEVKILADGVQFKALPASGIAVPGRVTTPTTELERQYAALVHDLNRRARFKRMAQETLRQDSLIHDSDRDPLDIVLRRTAALVNDILRRHGAPNLSKQEAELAKLKADATKVPVENAEARYDLYEKVCKLRREIAFKNPLLNFNELVFIKRHRAIFNHMCDQFYGICAQPGGGLYTLSNPFSDNPQVRDVLADATVTKGRLKGQKLALNSHKPFKISFDGVGNLFGEETKGGSFLSPSLSYDGKTILFAYVECTGDRKHDHHTDAARGHWAPGRSYHVFKVNVDGTGLEQLTDGTWNDFDPIFMPSGRICFISERRGGYLRCGRVCPTYTLYDMAADGSDIRCLSPHETNEWNPSVTNDGMIMYTRWDYVDRHGCTVHLPWLTTPDGRDARAVHGNFAPRHVRPDMELCIRPVPHSPKFSATAAPHHGQNFGSLVLIDPRVKDDDGMAPLKRITPDVGFPESQDGTESYGTAWPLSEDYFLCCYDAAMEIPGMDRKGNYGVYLVDSFGNKELLYRDPEIASMSPLPLRPRTTPPLVPERSKWVKGGQPAEGTLAVIDVYDSLREWPAGTKISALRIFHILPMSVPSGAPPHEIGMRLPTAGDSVILARSVVGTVPVEADGSAHFTVPSQKELFFQALDENGLAVQSMRSSTYLQPGERLVCQGCHEPRNQTPRPQNLTPLAMRRAPSKPTPDVDGSAPFSYPRLVQPVLDKHCVSCHAKNADKTFSLDSTVVTKGRQKWYASYHNLTPKYGFWNYGEAYRTQPGNFGARASKLWALLEKGHYDVKLSAEERHRIALWLDSCSIFYGVYEKEGGERQLRGEVVRPTLE